MSFRGGKSIADKRTTTAPQPVNIDFAPFAEGDLISAYVFLPFAPTQDN